MNNAPPEPAPPEPAPQAPSSLRIILHEPEIPNNTGNIGRSCVALGIGLDLIRPYAFDIDEKAVRRAGLDYWPRLSLREHDSWSSYRAANPNRVWLFTTRATRPYWDATFAPGDHLVFGKESKGLPQSIVDAHPNQCLAMPMVPNERSLNLSTAACVAAYEAVRQLLTQNHGDLNDAGRIRWNNIPLSP